MIQFHRRQNLTCDDTLPIQTVCTHVHILLEQWILAIFRNVLVQCYNVNIMDVRFRDSLGCFASFGSTRHLVCLLESFSHRVQAKLVLKARIFTQQFSNLTSLDRNITGVHSFLQPRLSFFIPFLHCFVSFTDGFVSIGHSDTHAKSTEVLEKFLSLCTVQINFHIRDPGQMKSSPITGMSNIVTRATIVRQPLRSLILVIPHSVAPCYDNTYITWFPKHGTEQLVANGRYFDNSPKGIHLDQFQKEFPKSTACLRQYIEVVCAVCQQILPIVTNSSPNKVCPIVLGFGIRAQIIQIVICVDEMGVIPLLSCDI